MSSLNLLASVGLTAVLFLINYCFIQCSSLERGGCSYGEVQCITGGCVSARYQCDGDADCGDGSDELHCYGSSSCSGSGFQCSSGRCIRRSQVCDGSHDCPGKDYSDESNCTCLPDEFRCNQTIRHFCVSNESVCNGDYDCPDGSDEEPDECQIRGCASTTFQCKDHRCIQKEDVCNLYKECVDGSDEEWEACPCDQTPHHKFCQCAPGFHIQFSKNGLQSCVDLDECELNTCDHFCTNFNGSHECNCDAGYVLNSDNKSCAFDGDPPVLLFRWHSVLMVSSLNLTSVRPTNVYSDISGFDVDSNAKAIYWTSAREGVIGRHILGDDDTQVSSANEILFRDLNSPTLLAYDWISYNLFVVMNDHEYAHSIVVCYVGPEVHKHSCATLYEIAGDDKIITGIAVSPFVESIFWTQVSKNGRRDGNSNGTGTGAIYKANMDGSHINHVAEGLINPRGLVLHHVFDRILWIDSGTKTIESLSVYGGNKTVVLQMQERLWGAVQGLAIVENTLAWIENGTFLSCKTSGLQQNPSLNLNSSCANFPTPFFSDALNLHVLHPALQPKGKDSCENNQCDFICTVRSPPWRHSNETLETHSPIANYKCHCPDGFSSPDDDNFNCNQSNTTEGTLVFKRKAPVKLKPTLADGKSSDSRSEDGPEVSFKCNTSTTIIITSLVVTLIAIIFIVLVRLTIRRTLKMKAERIKTRTYVELQSEAEGFRSEVPRPLTYEVEEDGDI